MSEVEQHVTEVESSVPTDVDSNHQESESPAPAATENVPSFEALPDAGRQERRDSMLDSLSAYIENAIESDKIQQDEILSGEGGHTGIDYDEVMSSLPDDAKKLLANMRADYTKKTMELAKERKMLQSSRESLATNDEFHEQLKQVAEEELEFNPYDEESFEKRVQKEVAQKLQEMIRPVREQHEVETRKLQLEQFKTAHPDLMDMKHDVAKVLMADENLSLEKAYWIVKGQKLAEQQQTQAAELAKYRKAAKDAGLRVGGASRARGGGIPAGVKAQGAWAIYKYLEGNKKG